MNRVSSIELLRFISALMVIIWHYQQFFLPYNPFSDLKILTNNREIQPFYEYLSLFYNYGNRGVDFFFLISGFVFSHVYLSEKNNTNFKTFFINRFARLYPLHFLTLIVVLIFQFHSNENYETFIIHFFNDTYHFILNFFFVSGWGFEKGPSFNGPVWSVSVEIIIYFFFFYLILYFSNLRFIKSILVVIFLIAFRKLIDDKYFNQINWQIINCALLFFEGVLVYYLTKKNKKNSLLLLIGLGLFTLSLFGNFKIYLFLPSIIIIFLFFEKFINQRLNNLFCFLGNLTYGTYLWHLPLQISLIIFFKNNNYDFNIMNKDSFFLIYLLLVFSISIVSYYFFEKKARFWIRSKFNK